jgi:hypothetical protein
LLCVFEGHVNVWRESKINFDNWTNWTEEYSEDDANLEELYVDDEGKICCKHCTSKIQQLISQELRGNVKKR